MRFYTRIYLSTFVYVRLYVYVVARSYEHFRDWSEADLNETQWGKQETQYTTTSTSTKQSQVWTHKYQVCSTYLTNSIFITIIHFKQCHGLSNTNGYGENDNGDDVDIDIDDNITKELHGRVEDFCKYVENHVSAKLPHRELNASHIQNCLVFVLKWEHFFLRLGFPYKKKVQTTEWWGYIAHPYVVEACVNCGYWEFQ